MFLRKDGFTFDFAKITIPDDIRSGTKAQMAANVILD